MEKERLVESVERIIASSKRMGLDCEIYCEDTHGLNIDAHGGRIESVEHEEETGIAVRVVEGRRVGYAFSSDCSDEGVQRLFESAKANARTSSPVDANVLAEFEEGSSGESLYEAFPSDFDMQFKREGVLKMEQACYDYDPSIVNTEGASYSEVTGEVLIAGTRGGMKRERRGYSACSISAVAKGAEDVKSGWFYQQALTPDGLAFEEVGARAAETAKSLIDARQIKTARYPTLIENLAFANLLGFVRSVLDGEKVVKKASVMTDRLGEEIASEKVTLIDDPFLQEGCFKAGFDAEGLATSRLVLIENGRLISFLNNVYSSRRLGIEPTANAVRASYRNFPAPGSTNLFLAAGKRSVDEIVSDLDEAVYVKDIMGLHTANPISGDFSFGMTGYYISKGSVKYPLSEMTISGNMLGLLRGVTELSRDLVFLGSEGSPAVLVEGLSIGGE